MKNLEKKLFNLRCELIDAELDGREVTAASVREDIKAVEAEIASLKAK